jgi:hypothetical protein
MPSPLRIVKNILIYSALATCGFWWSGPHKHPGPHTGQYPDPYHIEWSEHDVAGFHLLSPCLDTRGKHLEWVLPDGAMLEIPHEVEGPGVDAPDSIRTKS